MARQASGGISFSTQTNGISSVVASISNEAQQFSASNAGLVSATVFGAFETTLSAYEGTTRLTFSTVSTTAAMANGTFRLAKNAGNNTDRLEYATAINNWPAVSNYTVTAVTTSGSEGVTVAANDAAVPTNAGNDNILRINIIAKTSTGATVTSFVDVSFSKNVQGLGGNVIDLYATSEVFTSNFSGTADSGQSDIVISITDQGTPGNLSFSVSEEGAASVGKTTVADTKGNIKGFSTSTTGSFTTSGTISTAAKRLQISTANLGSNNEIQILVTGAAGGSDTLSIKKLKRGQGGITVVVNAAGGAVFAQGQTAGRVTTATVYDDDTGGIITANLSYTWRENSVSGDIVNVTSSSVRDVVQTGGTQATGSAFTTITVDRVDVVDNAAYICVVTES